MPHCPRCKRTLTDQEVRSIWASRNRALRTPTHAGGRPKSPDRCPCGAMTRERAEKRGHRCAAAAPRG